MYDNRREELTMATTETRYLVDKRGRKRAVVLGIREYARMVNRLEELEDALDLDEAVRTAGTFRDYQEVRKEMEAEGRL